MKGKESSQLSYIHQLFPLLSLFFSSPRLFGGHRSSAVSWGFCNGQFGTSQMGRTVRRPDRVPLLGLAPGGKGEEGHIRRLP